MKQGLLLLGCLVAAVGCKQAPPTQMETGYEVMTVAPADRMILSTYSATIRGRQDIDIYPQVSGFLTRLCVEEGQAVRKGQVLFIIDQVPYRAALQTAEANVEAASRLGLQAYLARPREDFRPIFAEYPLDPHFKNIEL